jgi:hypothetical protein
MPSQRKNIEQLKAWMKTLKSHVQKPKNKRRSNLRRMEK